MKVLLASQSPRRKEILKELFPVFDIEAPDAEEDYIGETPGETVLEIASRKAQSVKDSDKYDIIIACDTLVYFNGKYYGKPDGKAGAKQMLKELSGNTHEVISGLAVRTRQGIYKKAVSSYVTFRDMRDGEIDDYINNYQLLDKAGAYAVQDGVVVKSYKGDYQNIVGLPLAALKELIREAETRENRTYIRER